MAISTREELDNLGKRILSAAKTELYLSMHFLGPALGILSDVMDLSTLTCGTDAECVRFNPSYLLGAWTDDERQVNRLYMHMLLHCIFRHPMEACFYEALVRYGKRMTVEEVFDQVRRDKIFYDSSGGGVTVSGGEPLTHADFVAELFALCRGEGIHTCVETCGCVPQAAFEKVLSLTDTFYFDLKLMDSEMHREYTGQGNDQILSNARYLADSGAILDELTNKIEKM